MAHWGRALVIVGLLLAPAAGAAEVGSPFSGGGAASTKQPKAQDAVLPTQQTRAVSGTRTAPAPPHTTISSSKDYAIGPLDVLDISVFGVPDLSGTVEVAENGSLQLPLIGETPAAGKTAEELETELTSKLDTYLQNPQVRVTIKEYKSRTVIVTGDIATTGVYPLTGETTLLQIVAKAGGFKESSDQTALVVRKRGGQTMAAKFDVSEIQDGRVADPILQTGDTIVAGKSAIKGAYQMFLKALPVAGVFAFF